MRTLRLQPLVVTAVEGIDAVRARAILAADATLCVADSPMRVSNPRRGGHNQDSIPCSAGFPDWTVERCSTDDACVEESRNPAERSWTGSARRSTCLVQPWWHEGCF